ncbi:MAG TPA: AraC family transcriptional regulator [Cytophagales bacterium]|nr:AraC family transcriptional regulator [Cytophagales bacterium]HAP63267.1 AraC family transcriptional regulator [Cytophagales bacterium]
METSPLLEINSLSQFFEAIQWDKPKHPLIGVIDVAKIDYSGAEQYKNVRFTSALYSIMLKDGECGMIYGRNKYDFQEGVLQFIGPNQVISATDSHKPSSYGFMLLFHPDLIRNFDLGKRIRQYSFFNYEVHEALHLSKKEEDTLIEISNNIKRELEMNIDKHSQEVLVTNLQLLLNYANRFYERQFITRTNAHSDVVSLVEQHITQYYKEERQLERGIPTPDYIAEQVHFSTNYLSDLLKRETGRSVKDHIDDYTIELAKTALASTKDTINQIAYQLGFNYPHYFSRMFKKKTGESPNSYRAQFVH